MSDINQKPEETPDSDAKKSNVKEAVSWGVSILVAVLAAFLLVRFVIINATIPSGSMESTIEPGDRVIGLRFSYLFSDPQRGDIVVFKDRITLEQNEANHTGLTRLADIIFDRDKNLIKRVIGLPGEHVEIKDGHVYIDGTLLEEDYLKDEWTVKNDGMTFDVPEGCYLMMGDNRNNSSDCRYWAAKAVEAGLASTAEEAESYQYVPKSLILGKAYFRYWPLNRISSLY